MHPESNQSLSDDMYPNGYPWAEKQALMTEEQTRIFAEVAADPMKALEDLRAVDPEKADEISRSFDQAAEDNQKANAGRFRHMSNLSIREF